jgi:hypothetical protein
MKKWPMLIAAGALALFAGPTFAGAEGWHSTVTNGDPLVTGSGRVVRQARAVGSFQDVELKGSSNLQVELGRPLSLAVEADDNLLSQLTSEVVGGTLRLDTRGSFRTRTAPRIYLTAPNIEAITTSGSGNLVISGVGNRELKLVTRGSGNVIARGRTQSLTVKVQGSGNAHLQNIQAARADVAVLGSGNAWVKSTGAVRARSMGSGNVYVMGRPSSLDARNSGSGRVIRIGGR